MGDESAVDAWLRDTIDALIGLGAAVRRDETDAVHKARTMTRRLRVVLGLVTGGAARGARRELKSYGQLLGAARDLEVRSDLGRGLLDEIGDHDETDAAHRRLVDDVREERAPAHAAIVDYLDGPGYRALVENLEAVHSDAEPLDELAVRHEARKHARALRYLAEALGDEKTAQLGGALQDAFGNHRDYTLIARSLAGESDESLTRVRQAAHERGNAALSER